MCLFNTLALRPAPPYLYVRLVDDHDQPNIFDDLMICLYGEMKIPRLNFSCVRFHLCSGFVVRWPVGLIVIVSCSNNPFVRNGL